jgi:hypothetical protein
LIGDSLSFFTLFFFTWQASGISGAAVKLPVFVADVDQAPWWGKRVVRCIAIDAVIH